MFFFFISVSHEGHLAVSWFKTLCILEKQELCKCLALRQVPCVSNLAQHAWHVCLVKHLNSVLLQFQFQGKHWHIFIIYFIFLNVFFPPISLTLPTKACECFILSHHFWSLVEILTCFAMDVRIIITVTSSQLSKWKEPLWLERSGPLLISDARFKLI